jgi:hypothetical protein
MPRTLVLYIFHIYNDRVEYFLKNSIFYDETVDFIVISNKKELETSLERSKLPNVQYLFRDNVGYDFGGWSEALLSGELYKNYANFVFVNSSVNGPYLPAYFIGHWTDIYLAGLQGDVKLFGSTINTIRDPVNKATVQSYIFAMDRETLEMLIACNIFSVTHMASTFEDCIDNKEILMSRKIIEHGWNIGSLLPCFKGVDFRAKEFNIPDLDDVMFSSYRNLLWNEYDLVFIKGNRCSDIPKPNLLLNNIPIPHPIPSPHNPTPTHQ